MSIMTVELKELRFYAFHGLYGDEKKTGNEFEVSLCVDFDPVETVITNIAVTVNYARLYEIVKTEMQKPRALLETLAMEIVEAIHVSFPQIKKADISIKNFTRRLFSFQVM